MADVTLPRRRLGKAGPLVGLLGLGSVKFGRNEGVKFPNRFDLPSDDAVLALLEAAAALGINLIDTAPAYGLAEERLGRLLPQVKNDWVIVTKAGEIFEGGQSSFDFSAPAIRASVLRSLDRLRLSRLDGVLLHSDGVEEAGARFLPAMEALATLKGEGLIRAAGFSGKSVPGNMGMIGIADILMATYNRQETEQAPVIQAAGEKGLGVLIKKALASGHAANPAEDLAIAAGLHGVSSVVVGTLSPRHLEANARAVREGIAGDASRRRP